MEDINRIMTDIKPDEKWSMERDDGTVVIRNAHEFSTNDRMSKAHRMLLALNDLCCERGQGKVYMFVQHIGRNNLTHQARFDAAIAFREVPELFYVKMEWTRKEQEDYRRMTPITRSHFLMSRNGWLPDSMPVLPFDLELWDKKERPKVPEFVGLRAAPVTVYVCQHPYIGFTHEMRELCERRWEVKHDSTPIDCRFYAAVEHVPVPIGPGSLKQTRALEKRRRVWDQAWQDFERWKVAGLMGVLDRLDKFCLAKIEGTACAVLYIQLKRWQMLAARRASEMGQAYALLGDVKVI